MLWLAGGGIATIGLSAGLAHSPPLATAGFVSWASGSGRST